MRKIRALLVVGCWLLVIGYWSIMNAQEYIFNPGTTDTSWTIGNDSWIRISVRPDSSLHVFNYLYGERVYPDTNWVKHRITSQTGFDSTKIGYLAKDQSWSGFNTWTKRTIFQDDSTQVSGLWYDYPSTGRIAGGVLYDSLGNGVLKFRKMQPYILTTYPMRRNGDSLIVDFNSTNLKLTSNKLNTIQDIAMASAPTFGGLTAINGTSNTQTILPLLTDTYDLGSETKLWRKGWLSEMEAILFAKNTITLLGGWFYITKDAGTLPYDVNNSQTTIDFGKAMTPNDFIVFRQPLTVEYMQVNSLYAGTTYYVTRNLDGSGANIWAAGTPYAVFGQNGNGRIELNAYNTPRISMITQGATYNVQNEYIRIGDINGMPGYSTSTWGAYFGTIDNYMKWDATNGLMVKGSITVMGGNALSTGTAATDINNNITTINGGKITTGTVTLAQLNFTPVQTSNVVASINASAEGITISGAKLTINSATTFGSGYDPSTKTTSSEVTTIIGNTVTTSYLNAKAITALGAVTAGTFSLGSGAFSVDANGKLTSTSAAIAGWDINSTSIYKTNTVGTKSVTTYLSSNVSNYTTGLLVQAFDNSALKLNVQAGSYNDGGAARYGFAIWDNVNSKFLMNIGYGGTGNNMVATLSGLTIDGDMISSKFSTGPDFNETGSINFAKMQGNAFKSYDYVNYSGHSYQGKLDPYGLYIADLGNSPQWAFSINATTRTITNDGYNVPKFYGVTSSPSSINRQAGDTYMGTNGVIWFWSGTAWWGVQLTQQ